MKRYLDRLLPAVIIAVISWTLYANSQGSNSPGSRVTVVNPLSNPAIVTCANCGQISVGSISGTFTSSPTTVTIANSAAFPAIVSLVNVPSPLTVTCANCATGTVGGSLLVTIANSAAFPGIVSLVNIPNPLTVTCSNCTTSNATISGAITVQNLTTGTSLNVLDTNSSALLAAVQSSIPAGGNTIGAVSLINQPISVTCTNCLSTIGSITGTFTSTPTIVTIANSVAFPAIVTCTNCATGTVSGVVSINPAFVTVTNVNPNGIALITASSPVVIASNQPGLTIANAITILNSPANPVIALVTVSNTATQPAIVSCTNCGAATVNVSGPFNVTITNSITLSNTAAAPAIVSLVNIPAITISNAVITANVTVTNTNPNGQATMANSQSVAIASDQSALTINNNSRQFVTISNILTVSNTAAAPVIISLVNIPTGSGPLAVTCGNCIEVGESIVIGNTTANPVIGIVTVTNNVISPANVGVVVSGAASGGRTLITGYNQLTTPNLLKSTAGKLYKVVCLNPSAKPAYLEVFNLTPTSVQQNLDSATRGGSSAKPLLAYGIPTASNIVVDTDTGDQFSIAMTAIATLTIGGGLPPNPGLDCSFSIN